MYAKTLERILALLCERSDVSPGTYAEMIDRFRSLRDYGRLPRGRARREEKLSQAHIAAAVFGLVAVHPKWAGHVAILLEGLRPVGGPGASFFATETLGDAIAVLLTNEDARRGFIRLTATVAETGVNSNGGAEILYERDGYKRHAYFVPRYAVSLLQAGREIGFDPDRSRLNAPATREMSFNARFFERLAQEYELAERFPAAPEGDGSEYNEEEAEQERYRKLGVRARSRFLNVGVENAVTWPKEEMLIKFDRYHLVLMPKTADNVQSVHIDLAANRLDHREAMTVVNRFLSILAWCNDNFAIAQDGWSGNPVPVPVAKRNLAFMTASNYIFDRKIPVSEKARRALALFREARNAQQNGFISYAVLNYYKLIEIPDRSKNGVKKWFQVHLEELRSGPRTEDIERFFEMCGQELPHEYIHKSCRLAVAHANKYSKSDPDDAHEIARLHTAANVMHLLARRFIEQEFAISTIMFSGD